jgi:hypothetical protein
MPTNRTRTPRHRRAPVGSPEELWQQGRYVEAMARCKYVEFAHVDYIATHADRIAARELRERLGLTDDA